MNVDIDTRKLELKQGDLLIHDGNKFLRISKNELFAELIEEIEETKNELITVNKQLRTCLEENKKLRMFIRKLGGAKIEKV